MAGIAVLLAAGAAGLISWNARASQLSGQITGQANIDDNYAEVVLGHSLPQIRDAAAAVTRVSLTVSDAVGPNIPRIVDQIYARQGKRTIVLSVWRGKLGATDSVATTTTISGRTAYVLSHVVGDGSTDVAYTSEFEGVSFILHVRLTDGLSRQDADRIFASVN